MFQSINDRPSLFSSIAGSLRFKVIAVVAVVWVLVCGILLAFWATPYYALWSMRSAALNRDAAGFCSYIDFPTLRENLKAELNAKMLFEMNKDEKMKNNPFSGLAVAAGPAIINNAIDGYVTPAAIEQGFKQELPKADEKNVANQTLNRDFLNDEKGKVTTGYSGLNQFHVTFIPNEGKGSRFIFERRTLVRWELVAIKFD